MYGAVLPCLKPWLISVPDSQYCCAGAVG